jgi:hypothetical protein
LGSREEMACREGFVICGILAWLVFPTLTMVVHANDGPHNTFWNDLVDI